MQETFYEESVSSARATSEAKLYTAFRVAAYVCFVLGALFLTIFLFSYIPGLFVTGEEETKPTTQQIVVSIVFWAIPPLLLLGMGFLLLKYKNRFNLSYDYIFVTDELRVSKVFNGLRRKFYKRFNTDMILQMGKCENDSFRRITAGMGKKQIVYLTPNREPREGREFYYMLYSSSTEKTVYILESKVELIEYILRAAGRNKWESR